MTSCFSSFWQDSVEFQKIVGSMQRKHEPIGVLGLSPIHKAHLLAALCETLQRQALLVAPEESTAQRLCEDLQSFGLRVRLFPARDLLLRTAETRSREYEHARLAALDALRTGACDVLVCAADAVLQRTLPPAALAEASLKLEAGMEHSLDALVQALCHAGYTHAEQVEGEGQFARRGGILDIFPVAETTPVRLEFWDETIDTIASFDPESQRRTETLTELKLLPAWELLTNSTETLAQNLRDLCASLKGKGSAKARKVLQTDLELLEQNTCPAALDRYTALIYPEFATVLEYLPPDGILVFSESFSIRERATASEKLWLTDLKSLVEEGLLCAGLEALQRPWRELLELAERRGVLYFDHLPRGGFDTPVQELVSVEARQLQPWNGSLEVLVEDISNFRKQQSGHLVLFAGTEKAAQTLVEDLTNEEISALYCPVPPAVLPKGICAVLPGSLSAGAFYATEHSMILTYGGKKPVPKARVSAKKGTAKNVFRSLEELKKGDYVVHRAHGIGIFDGIHSMTSDGSAKDYIKIQYHKADILYLPVTQLDQVTRYVGPTESGFVKLSRLGGKDWQKTKSKVSESVKDIARELTALYAKRLEVAGYAFAPHVELQADFDRRFEFDETSDQLRCIEEIRQDMERPYPMDRLLCGDVGFGKTEVALRAVFQCVANGKQCAILVPTTILAFQHFQTIQRRFDAFPIEIAMLSRFVSPQDSKQILKNAARGALDVVVGTHRLLSKNLAFRDLGLIIIDEEQRFGVAQKESLKERYPNVDVLTLTATPIPRTLHMAMSEIRDMSVIDEPPQDRQPVQTYVLAQDLQLLAQAMRQELRRNGQVYYLYNRVEDIEHRAHQIKELLPDAVVEIAHGQMDEETLSDVWRRLLEGEISVLVCTTIIETGIDVPNVNTLIIENADRMGLAQLHQIRGRVGRAARRASAYFTFRPNKELTEVAHHRLEAIREFTEFGSGFRIAMRDLELRGAGSLLGAQQSGHVEAVGYDLYMELLADAVAKEKEQTGDASHENSPQKDSMPDCKIDLPIDAHLPEDYISSVQHRLGMYRRIAEIRTEEDALDVTDELIDRFGEPPAAVQGLLEIALVRAKAVQHHVFELSLLGTHVALYISELDMKFIQELQSCVPGGVKVHAGNGKPYISVRCEKHQTLLGLLKKIF